MDDVAKFVLALVRDILATPEYPEKAPPPSVERFFSLPAAATRGLLYSDAFETTRHDRAELKCPTFLGSPL